MIEAREQQERERMLAKAQAQEAVVAPTSGDAVSTLESSEQRNPHDIDEVHQTSPREEKGRPHTAMPSADVDQPVPWTPMVARRG